MSTPNAAPPAAPKAPPAAAAIPAWQIALIDTIESMWKTTAPSKSEPNHAVTKKIAALKEAMGIKSPAAVPSKFPLVAVPSPLPLPNPLAGQDAYENLFNTRYYQTRDERLAPFFYGRPGAQAGTELTQDQKWDLCDKLNAENVEYDEEIDAQGERPYGTMYQRQEIYGYTREPRGKGRQTGEPTPVDKADFFGPVIAGYLPVTCDINKL